MRLIRLALKDFKGVHDFTLDTHGRDVSVFGENRTGKTTLFDAFLWVLFDKDSANRKDFEIKTLTPSGEALHNLDHDVEVVLEQNGKTMTLRKVYSEKYTKKRGSAQQEFSGHTTDYYVNSVPVGKREYDDQIKAIANEDIFRLLTNPLYFNENLHWKARRNLLVEVCGNISDEDVIASDKELARLPEILGDYSQEQRKAIIQGKRKEINDELEKLPTRIDEATRSLADITDIDPATLPGEISAQKSLIRAKNEELSRIKSGGEIAEKTKAIRIIESELLDILRKDREGIEEQIAAKKRELSDINGKASRLRADASAIEYGLSRLPARVTANGTIRESLLQEYNAINVRQFTCSQETVCPACDRPLDEEKLQAARDKALEGFNLKRAQDLEANRARGFALKEDTEKLAKEIADLTDKVNLAKHDLAVEEASVAMIQQEIDELRRESLNHTGGEAYVAKSDEKKALEFAIEQLKADNTEAIAGVQQEITNLNATLDGLMKSQAAITNNQTTEKRIVQLKEQERTLAAEFERLEGELCLCDQFTRVKVNMLNERINSRFKLARFRMFEEQINGGLAECCETTFGGVPYSSLNHEAQINIGLDIISTLIEHYGFSAPVFVDNAEAVTRLIDIPAQMIRLVVSADDKALRVA
jgi:DNA repair exonuclease SbcCD ATPase subunit